MSSSMGQRCVGTLKVKLQTNVLIKE